jgi:hypothetical protein
MVVARLRGPVYDPRDYSLPRLRRGGWELPRLRRGGWKLTPLPAGRLEVITKE